MEANTRPVEPSTERTPASTGTPPSDGTEYNVRYVGTSLIPLQAFTGGGTLAVQAGMIRLSGMSWKGFLVIALLFPFVMSFNNHMAPLLFGVQIKIIPLLVIFAALFVVLHYKWNYFSKSAVHEKEQIRNVVRNGRKVSFDVSDPSGTAERPVKVTLKARNEEEAAQIENALRA